MSHFAPFHFDSQDNRPTVCPGAPLLPPLEEETMIYPRVSPAPYFFDDEGRDQLVCPGAPRPDYSPFPISNWGFMTPPASSEALYEYSTHATFGAPQSTRSTSNHIRTDTGSSMDSTRATKASGSRNDASAAQAVQGNVKKTETKGKKPNTLRKGKGKGKEVATDHRA